MIPGIFFISLTALEGQAASPTFDNKSKSLTSSPIKAT